MIQGLKHPLSQFLLIGMLIRLILAPFTTMPYDMSFWAGVINGFNMGEGLYESEYYWYSPTWGYILSFMTPLINILGIDVQGFIVPDENDHVISYVYAAITDPKFNLVIKTPLIISDILVSLVIYKLAYNFTNDERKSAISAGIWLLCPLAIWNSAVQGQFDTLSILGMMSAFYFLIQRSYFLAGFMIAFGTVTKLFPGLFVPLMIGFVISKEIGRTDCLNGISKMAGGFAICTLLILLPVTLMGNFEESFYFLTDRIDSYSDSSASDFFRPLWGNIFTIFPIIIILILTLTIRLAVKKDDNTDRRFMILATATLLFIFAWPNIPPYSQYALLMMPMFAILLNLDFNMKLPIILTSILFTTSVLLLTGPSIIYPLSMGTGIIPPESVESAIDSWYSYSGYLYYLIERLKFIPALLGLLILAIKNRKEIESIFVHWRNNDAETS